MESWKKVWREGIAPLMPTAGLEALALALASDDARLLQGATISPPPLQCVSDWPVEAACVIGYCGWQDEPRRTTVAAVEEFFAQSCFDCDQRMGEPAACRWLLNWFDDLPREQVIRELLPEVQRTIVQRKAMEGVS